jgi:hypothetical protein
VQAHFAKTEKRQEPPALVRLLDLRTPRLVGQTLFESIRLTDMCLVDWTGLRTNVIFEAGVRMAVNPLGAVHVIERGEYERLRVSNDQNTQKLDILRLFDLVEYPLGGVDLQPFDQMVRRFDHAVEANASGETNPIYGAIGTAIDHRSQPAALPLVKELVRSANVLHSDDQESVGISPVLYHEINHELVNQARDAAADRRLAAWLFVARRYSDVEIANDSSLLADFELLSAQVRRWARRNNRNDLVDEISEKARRVRDAAATSGGSV